MKRIRIVGLGLVAVFALSAATAASASAALPEFKVCVKVAKEEIKYTEHTSLLNAPITVSLKVYTGKYTENTCKVLAPAGTYRAGGAPEGAYELESGLPKNIKTGKSEFKTTSGPSEFVVSGEPHATVECTSSKSKGEYTGTNEEKNVVVEYKGCKAPEAGGYECKTPGAKFGMIKTNPLKGELGYLAGKGTSKPTVGVLLEPEAGGGYWSEAIDCTHFQLRTKGSVIAEVTGDINTISKASSNVFQEAGGKQKWRSFEGGPEQELLTEVDSGMGFGPPGGARSFEESTASVSGQALEIEA